MTKNDLILREDAVKTIHRYKYRLEGSGQTYGFLLEEFENRIPSAEAKVKCIAQIKIDRDDLEDLVNEKINEILNNMSETKIGKWIKTAGGDGWSEWDVLECPFCGAIIEDKHYHPWKYNFCPHCQADLRGNVK